MSEKIYKYDISAKNKIRYRKDGLEQEIDRIRRTMEGYYVSVYPDIIDDEGIIVTEKLDEMINDMLEALDRYYEITGTDQVDEKQKDWYRCFLYCVITCPEIDTQNLMPEYSISRNFGDIVDLADIDPKLQDIEEFIWNENHEWRSEEDTQRDILFYLCNSYQHITQTDINKIYDEDQRRVYEYLKPSFVWGVEDRNPDMSLEEQTNIKFHISYINTEEDPIIFDKVPNDVILTGLLEDEKEDQRQFEEAAESWKRWNRHIGNVERYKEEYLNFRRLFFKADLTRMKEDMQHMLEVYLYEKGISAYSIQDSYGLVYEAVRTTSKRIWQMALRARELS